MRRSSLATAATIGLAVAAAGMFTAPARAEGPTTEGWWTSTTPAGLPISGVTPPDVPTGGLLIQGGPGAAAGPSDTGATAYAALVFGIAPNATVTSLTLTEVASSLSTPGAVLELCALTDSAFSAASGGPISAAPPYDCSQAVTATQSSSGATFTFSVGQLVASNQVAVAVLPTSPVERVVLAAPGENALGVSSASATTLPPPTSTPTTVVSAPTGAPVATTVPAGPAPVVPAVSAPTPSASNQGVNPAVAPLETTSTTVAHTTPRAAAVLPASTASSSGPNPAAMIIALALLLLGAAAWLVAGRPASAAPASGDHESAG